MRWIRPSREPSQWVGAPWLPPVEKCPLDSRGTPLHTAYRPGKTMARMKKGLFDIINGVRAGAKILDATVQGSKEVLSGIQVASRGVEGVRKAIQRTSQEPTRVPQGDFGPIEEVVEQTQDFFRQVGWSLFGGYYGSYGGYGFDPLWVEPTYFPHQRCEGSKRTQIGSLPGWSSPG